MVSHPLSMISIQVIGTNYNLRLDMEKMDMTKVFIWKNNCPYEWQEISFKAFRKARNEGAFSGRFFLETARKFDDEDDRIILECTQANYEKYIREDRHSHYLYVEEKKHLTIPASDVDNRDPDEDGYEDTDIFVNEESGTEDLALHNMQLKKLTEVLNQLEPSEREFILAYYSMDKPSTIQLGRLFDITQPAALYRQKKILRKLKKLFI